MAWVVLADTAIELVAISLAVQRLIGISLARQWEAVRSVALVCPPTWATAFLVAKATADSEPGVSLAASVLGALAVYLVGLSLLEPGLLRQAIGQVGRTLRRVPAVSGETPAGG